MFGAIAIKEKDNVATALKALNKGEPVTVSVGEKQQTVAVSEDIEMWHKLSLRDIRCGENILKYGEIIGRATRDIPCGAHVHVQNIESLRGRGDIADEGVK